MKTDLINEFEDAFEQSATRDQYSGGAVAAIIGWHLILILMLTA